MFYNASSEDIEFPSFDSNNVKLKKFERKEKLNKNCLIIIILISVLVILIVGIALVIYFGSKKKESGGFIYLLYIFPKNNQIFKLFDPPSLTEDDYEVDYNGGNIPIRMLMDSKKNYKDQNQCINGTCHVNITFKKPVSNLKGMFANIPELKSADFSGFVSENVINMNNLFYNCTNLEKVELGNFNAENLETMDSIFQNCSSLTEMDLSSFETPRLSSINSAIKGCTNLVSFNMEKFILSGVNIEDDFFEGCKILVDFVSPKKYSEQINEIYNKNINLTNIADLFCEEDKDCQICKTIKIGKREIEIDICDYCPSGFFKYNFTRYDIKCKKCEIPHCSSCYSEQSCGKCEINYKLNETVDGYECLYDYKSNTTNNDTTANSTIINTNNITNPTSPGTDLPTDENLL